MNFDFATRASPAQVLEAMTDFTDRRLETWSTTLDPQVYEVRDRGDTWAVAREGSPRSPWWVVVRYDWSDPGLVRWTELETNHGDPGEGLMRIEPGGGGGSRVHVEWSTHPVRVRDKAAMFVLHRTMNPVIARMWRKTLDRFSDLADDSDTVDAAARRTVRVDAGAVDWTIVRLVTVELRHSHPATGSVHEQQLVFTAHGPSSQEWQFPVAEGAPATYMWQATYAAPDGSQVSSPEQVSADDVLLLPATPPGAEGLRTVQVVAEAIDWTDIHRVVVELRYAAPATGFTTEEHLAFSADTSPVLEWQFIAPGDGPRVYQWEASYLAHDGRRFVRDGAATLDEALSLPPGTS
jgi:hypothetical protein